MSRTRPFWIHSRRLLSRALMPPTLSYYPRCYPYQSTRQLRPPAPSTRTRTSIHRPSPPHPSRSFPIWYRAAHHRSLRIYRYFLDLASCSHRSVEMLHIFRLKPHTRTYCRMRRSLSLLRHLLHLRPRPTAIYYLKY